MTSPIDAAPARLACPACGAGTRPGADWCSLCYADLRPVPPPRVVPPPRPAAAPAGAMTTGMTTTADSGPAVVPVLACTVCGDPVPLEHSTCPHCGSGVLDGLRSAAVPSLRLPVVGDLMRFGRGARAGIMLLLSLSIVVVLIGLVTLLG